MVTLLWLATSGSPASAAEDGPFDGVTVPAPFVAPDDLVFLDATTAHHRHTVAMADQVIERGTDPRVARLARRMRDVRTRDLSVLESVRDALGDDPPTPREPDPHAEEDLELLRGLSGDELDRAFLAHAIPHDALEIALAHYAVDGLERPDLRAMAADAVSHRAREIGDLRALLRELERAGGDGA